MVRRTVLRPGEGCRLQAAKYSRRVHRPTGDDKVRTTAARAIAATAFAVGLTLATAGTAGAQSGPSGPSTTAGPSGPSGPGGSSTSATTAGTVAPTTARPGGSGLARTGGEAALPLAASAAAITIVLGGRRLASRLSA
jgi:hypothetical protein